MENEKEQEIQEESISSGPLAAAPENDDEDTDLDANDAPIGDEDEPADESY